VNWRAEGPPFLLSGPDMAENGSLKLSMVVGVLTAALGGMLGFFISDLQAGRKDYLTIREHEEYVRHNDSRFNSLSQRMLENNNRIVELSSKVDQLPTINMLNNWIYDNFPNKGSVGQSRKDK
jgi:hypothetical protein